MEKAVVTVLRKAKKAAERGDAGHVGSSQKTEHRKAEDQPGGVSGEKQAGKTLMP